MNARQEIQRTNAYNIGKANIGDRIAFTSSIKGTARVPASTVSANGILTAVQVLGRLGVIRATVDGEIYTLGPTVIVDVERATDARPLTMPKPETQRRRRFEKSTERLRTETAAELFGIRTQRPVDSLSANHVGHEIAFAYGDSEFTGTVTSVERGFAGMTDVGVDGRHFVFPGDKVVTVIRHRMSTAS
tara:strand:+ start:6780 stop:7346 length:567 start_codon:yes stop_codon:yes gene_type:complete